MISYALLDLVLPRPPLKNLKGNEEVGVGMAKGNRALIGFEMSPWIATESG